MADAPKPPPSRGHQGRVIGALILVVLLLVFAFQNRDPVNIDYIVFTRDTRLIYIIIGSAALGALTGGLVRRHRRRRRGRDGA